MRKSNIDKIKNSYDFLLSYADSGKEFNLDELMNSTGWTEENSKTNLGKRMSEFVEKVRPGVWRVLPIIKRVRLDDYTRLFRQKNLLFGTYNRVLYSDLLVYDFLMPLTREDRLRKSLDNLFYRDRLEQRLREIGAVKIRQAIAPTDGEGDAELVTRAASIAGEAFVGYSISMVSGRFRMRDLMDGHEIAQIPPNEQSYLADETTAVVRFIMRCSGSKQELTSYHPDDTLKLDELNDEKTTAIESERKLLRWLFLHLFAEAVVMTVNYEEEIWLLEQGPDMRLWVWERASIDDV